MRRSPLLLEVTLALLGIDVGLLNARDLGGRWSLVERLYKLLDLRVVALGFTNDLWPVLASDAPCSADMAHRSIRGILDEASDADIAGTVGGKRPKANAYGFSVGSECGECPCVVGLTLHASADLVGNLTGVSCVNENPGAKLTRLDMLMADVENNLRMYQ